MEPADSLYTVDQWGAMSLRAAFASKSRCVTITVDATPVEAQEGEMLAAALWAAGIVALKPSSVSAEPRGPLCFMGVCQECTVRVDGVRRQSCLVPVADGMAVERDGLDQTLGEQRRHDRPARRMLARQ